MTVEGDCYVFRCSQSKQKLSTAKYEYLKARNSAKRLKLQEVENIETCKLNDKYDEDNQEGVLMLKKMECQRVDKYTMN